MAGLQIVSGSDKEESRLDFDRGTAVGVVGCDSTLKHLRQELAEANDSPLAEVNPCAFLDGRLTEFLSGK